LHLNNLFLAASLVPSTKRSQRASQIVTLIIGAHQALNCDIDGYAATTQQKGTTTLPFPDGRLRRLRHGTEWAAAQRAVTSDPGRPRPRPFLPLALAGRAAQPYGSGAQRRVPWPSCETTSIPNPPPRQKQAVFK
jgi:hypothetical protein